MEVVDAGIPSAVKSNLEDLRTPVNLKVNEAIAAASAAARSSLAGNRSVLGERAAVRLANWQRCYGVYSKLGTVVIQPINVLEHFLMGLPEASTTATGKIYYPAENDTKYKGGFKLGGIPVPYQFAVAPVVKVDGYLVGTDKLGHFVEIGYLLFCQAHPGQIPDTFVPDVTINADGSRTYQDVSD